MSAWQENPRILISKKGHEGAKLLEKRRGEPMNAILEFLVMRENRRLDAIQWENRQLEREAARRERAAARALARRTRE